MPPKIRDLSLTTTERTAIVALLQAEQQLVAQMERVNADKAAIAADIETRLRLPAGALTDKATHQIDIDEMKVVVRNGDSPD